MLQLLLKKNKGNGSLGEHYIWFPPISVFSLSIGGGQNGTFTDMMGCLYLHLPTRKYLSCPYFTHKSRYGVGKDVYFLTFALQKPGRISSSFLCLPHLIMSEASGDPLLVLRPLEPSLAFYTFLFLTVSSGNPSIWQLLRSRSEHSFISKSLHFFLSAWSCQDIKNSSPCFFIICFKGNGGGEKTPEMDAKKLLVDAELTQGITDKSLLPKIRHPAVRHDHIRIVNVQFWFQKCLQIMFSSCSLHLPLRFFSPSFLLQL